MTLNYNNKKYTDLTYLHELSKGNADFELKMINTFVNQAQVDVQKMKQALVDKNWDVIYLIAHKMKASLHFVGLSSLHADMLSVELYAKQRTNFQELPELISSISSIIEIAIDELNDEITKRGVSN